MATASPTPRKRLGAASAPKIVGTPLEKQSRPTLMVKNLETVDSTSDEFTPKSRREALIRQPSYCKILDDLQDTGEKIVNMKSERPDSDSSDAGAASSTTSVQTITINGQQYQIVSPAAMPTAEAIQALAANSGISPGSPGTVASTAGGALISVGSRNSPRVSPSGSLDLVGRSGEESARKREIRLAKNREAARECRNKKKEYIKCLENRVAVLENQNKALIEELKSLKELYTGQQS